MHFEGADVVAALRSTIVQKWGVSGPLHCCQDGLRCWLFTSRQRTSARHEGAAALHYCLAGRREARQRQERIGGRMRLAVPVSGG